MLKPMPSKDIIEGLKGHVHETELDETAYLLSSEANAKALYKSIKQAEKSQLYGRPEK